MSRRPAKPDLAALRAAREAKAAELLRAAEAAKASGEARIASLEQRQKARADQLAATQAQRAQQLETRRDALRKRVAAKKPERPRRRADPVRWILFAVIAILLLLLLLRRCEEPEPEPEPAGVLASGGASVPDPLPAPPPRPAPEVETRERPPLQPPPVKVPPWIVGFRMQVSARSPRLAKCFEGMERPGRIKWTATVEPSSGQVADHLVEPQLLTGELSAREVACVTDVLSSPDYRISAPDDVGPSRISVVLEF